MTSYRVIGIDLAAKSQNPTGLALLELKNVRAYTVYPCSEILTYVRNFKPSVVAIDAPLKPPKVGVLRMAEREMIKRGYRLFPPVFAQMKTLTARAAKLNKLLSEEGYKVIEVHPTSTRKALNIHTKNREEIRIILKDMGLEGDVGSLTLNHHEIDAIISALTGYLYLEGKTETVGDEEEGLIIVPKRQDWRAFNL